MPSALIIVTAEGKAGWLGVECANCNGIGCEYHKDKNNHFGGGCSKSDTCGTCADKYASSCLHCVDGMRAIAEFEHCHVRIMKRSNYSILGLSPSEIANELLKGGVAMLYGHRVRFVEVMA